MYYNDTAKEDKMPNVTINERLAQLISEKNMGLKASSAADISNVQTTETVVENVRYTKQDSVELNGSDSETSRDTSAKRVVVQQAASKKINTDGNPFIHNQVVDDIAKKMLKAFTGG